MMLPDDTMPPTQLAPPPPLLSRKTLTLIGLVGLLVVVLFGAGFLLNKQPSQQVAQGQPTATATGVFSVQATATAYGAKGATATPHPTPGWEDAGPAWAQNIAFAPGDRNTVYTCGAADGSYQTNYQWPMQVGVSHDGGASWQSVKTGVQGNECYFGVSPANPQYAVLDVDGDGGACADCPGANLLRTLDGGQTWQQLSLPPNGTTNADQFSGFAWVGTTLYALPFTGLGTQAKYYLAASRDGGAFVWLDQSGVFGGVQPTFIFRLIGEGNMLYAIFTSPSCGCQEIAITSDQGATWSRVIPSDGQGSIAILSGSTITGTLYGIVNVNGNATHLVRSSDAGHTWRQIPAPQAFVTNVYIYDTPDGSLYGMFSTGIYTLAPHATTWRQAAGLPGSNVLLAVQYDSGGHPAALWGLAAYDNTRGMQALGLQRHAP